LLQIVSIADVLKMLALQNLQFSLVIMYKFILSMKKVLVFIAIFSILAQRRIWEKKMEKTNEELYSFDR